MILIFSPESKQTFPKICFSRNILKQPLWLGNICYDAICRNVGTKRLSRAPITYYKELAYFLDT